MKIYIPSKGRSKLTTTTNLLKDFFICVEPNEYEEYKSIFGNQAINIQQSNQGIAYVRNFILEREAEPFWMLDDDISAFYLNIAGKNVKTNADEVLQKATQLFKEFSFAQGALEYQQYGWGKKTKLLSTNTYCDVAVYINPKLVGPIRYRSHFNMKEDRDFTLQLIRSGARVGRYCFGSFQAPKNGSNKGGLYEDYAQKSKELISVDRMVEEWFPVVTKQKKTDGRVDCKIDWRLAGKLWSRK